MTGFTLQLTDERAVQLRRLAVKTGYTPDDIPRESVRQPPDSESAKFLAAANRVV
ncbi:MAG: hypothetical protein ACE5KM_19005 [Planctomycetaceae bacterium]